MPEREAKCLNKIYDVRVEGFVDGLGEGTHALTREWGGGEKKKRDNGPQGGEGVLMYRRPLKRHPEMIRSEPYPAVSATLPVRDGDLSDSHTRFNFQNPREILFDNANREIRLDSA